MAPSPVLISDHTQRPLISFAKETNNGSERERERELAAFLIGSMTRRSINDRRSYGRRGDQGTEKRAMRGGTTLERREGQTGSRQRRGPWNWFRSTDHWKQSSLLNSPPTHPTDIKVFFGMIYREPSKQVDIVSTDDKFYTYKTCPPRNLPFLPPVLSVIRPSLQFIEMKTRGGERGRRKKDVVGRYV